MLVIIGIIVIVDSSHAFADTCSATLKSYNAPQFYLLSDGVFVGTVQHIDNATNHMWRVYFNVDKIWRGSISPKPLMVMTTDLQGCGYSITRGEKYLVYTNGYPPFFNTVWSKPYADAQNDLAIIDDPKFQSDEKAKEELNKKLQIARDAISNLMGSKMGDMPFNMVGVDEINSTLDIGIDSAKATMSEGQYLEKIRRIVGDIPVKITFGQIWTTALGPVDTSVLNNSQHVMPPLKQLKSGVGIRNIVCKNSYYLVVKSHNQDPACLKAGTISKLASRGLLYGTNASNPNYTTIIIPPGSENSASPNSYSPDSATVVLGVNNTVRWVNQADTANTIVPDMPLTQNGIPFGSDGVIKPKQSYQFTFTEPGTFPYHTEPHPWMKGSITVLPLSTKATLGATKMPDSFVICNTPYAYRQGFIPVLYMPTNSVGKICVNYWNPNHPKNASLTIFDANSHSPEKSITTYGEPDVMPVGNSTVTYTVMSGNKTGFYGMMVFCVGMPFAVGYDNSSNIVAGDFSWESSSTFYCPMMDFQYTVLATRDIGIKYIPYP